MRLLLDTHIAVWAVVNDPRLTSKARSWMGRDGDISVSIASIWEIAIKFSLQRRTTDMLPMSGADAHACFLDAGFAIVPIEPSHVATLEHLLWIHRDPFDRPLVATALATDRHLLTHDAALLA